MYKHIFRAILGLIGIIGTLALGIVHADVSVTHYTGSNISYTLNGNETFTGVGTITITDGVDTITILDRNLGATKAGTGCEDLNWEGVCYGVNLDPTYGYHFQWGNNHGFKPCSDSNGCSTFPNGESTGAQLTSITYNPFYDSSIFIQGSDNWMSDDSIVDLWGGSTGDYIDSLSGDNWKVNNASDRQGPCPENFHVPSFGEFLKIRNMMGNSASAIHTGLLIPFASTRYYGNTFVYDLGSIAYFWSSSPYDTPSPFSRNFGLDVDDYLSIGYDYRADAILLRCLYDFYEPYQQNTTGNQENVKIIESLDTGHTYMGQTINTLTICNPEDDNECITMMDRNLGATTNDITSTGSYGYHFQWGNNHGFESCYESGCDTFPGGETTSTTQVDCSVYQPLNWANNNVFILGSGNRCITPNTNMWGGGSDNESNNWGYPVFNPTERQGICPAGFHIPSIGEWRRLLDMRAGESVSGSIETYKNISGFGTSNVDPSTSLQVDSFLSDFKIPLGGYRNENALFIRNITDKIIFKILDSSRAFNYQGLIGEFLSSSYGSVFEVMSGSGRMKILFTNINADIGYIKTVSVDSGYNAGSIRCFRNKPINKIKNLNVLFMSGDVILGTGIVIEDTTGSVPNDINININEGYNLIWNLSGIDSTTDFDFENTPISLDWADENDNVYFIAKWLPIEYTIIYELDDGINNPNNVTGYTIEDTITFENPTKDGYSFDGWFTDAQFTTGITDIQEGTTGDITLYAKWSENIEPSGGYSGGGGGSSSKSEDASNNPSVTDVTAPHESGAQGEDSDSSSHLRGDTASAERNLMQTYTEEFQQAYEFAHEKGITTMSTIQDAKMDGKLTRIAMAKILSQYAINVLGQKPDETRNNKFNDISEKLDAQYDNGVILAYQLGIMGINMPDNRFRPNDLVTRAEFATALSRMLYSTPDGKPYYTTHLEKLKSEGILTNDNPKMKEMRGYVMIMLMRAAK